MREFVKDCIDIVLLALLCIFILVGMMSLPGLLVLMVLHLTGIWPTVPLWLYITLGILGILFWFLYIWCVTLKCYDTMSNQYEDF